MTASRPGPPFRADHVGSLLRPEELKKAFREFGAGKIRPEQFREIQNRAIRNVVALQESIGLESITDGEFRRASYWAHFVDAVEGFEVREAQFHFRDEAGAIMNFSCPHTAGRLRRRHGISTEEFKYLREITARTPKITMPSPSTMHFWRGRVGYQDIEVFFADLSRIYREEIAELAELGARYIQLDEVPLAMLCDPQVREAVQVRGEDCERLVDTYIAAINLALEGRPPGVSAVMHLCRGNYKGKWMSEGGYESVAERLFASAGVDAFFLEYDSPRAGDFTPLRFVPADKMAVLGLISTKTPQLEVKDAIKRRVEEATRFVALERLAISPQCGFASTVGGNPVTEDDEKRKLELLVEMATEIWSG
jgi:5-methyltetrahydropteroyltriglutamate--homocysteine methyltransferase